MPLLRIDLPAGRDPEWRETVGEAVQEALHATPGVPTTERFQVIAEHRPSGLMIDHGYVGIERSAQAVLVQVTLNRGRDPEKKRAFFRALVERLDARAGIRPADVVANLIEIGREDWSFGNGEAQLA